MGHGILPPLTWRGRFVRSLLENHGSVITGKKGIDLIPGQADPTVTVLHLCRLDQALQYFPTPVLVGAAFKNAKGMPDDAPLTMRSSIPF